jgi:hypothetical protein
VPILNRFNSFKASKKCLVAMMEYTSLEKATGNFSENNVLGVGGFGCVYKANFDGGLVAAVKRLGGEDQEYEKEFEVIIVCGIGCSPILFFVSMWYCLLNMLCCLLNLAE